MTLDIDIAVSVSGDPEAEALVRDLIASDYRLRESFEQERANRLATVRLTPADAAVGAETYIDLLFASSGIEPEVVATSQVLPLTADLRVPVAGISSLLALKTLSRSPARPHDSQDLFHLLDEASPIEIEEARSLLDLVTSRGFQRAKNLRSEFDDVLRLHAERKFRG